MSNAPTAVQTPSGRVRRARPPAASAGAEPEPADSITRSEAGPGPVAEPHDGSDADRAGAAQAPAAAADGLAQAPAPAQDPHAVAAMRRAAVAVAGCCVLAAAGAGAVIATDAAWARWLAALSIATATAAAVHLARALRAHLRERPAAIARAVAGAATDAARDAAHTRALLHEARQDLERALHVGGPGRYTGQTLGSFRIGVLLGRGAMGEVYEAARDGAGGRAAVKLLHAHVRQVAHHRERFMREAKASTQLDSDHIVRVIEVGATDADVPYLAMERLEGEDLAHHLRRHPRLPLPEVIELVRQVGEGLAAARAAGIVHRDIKPQNLFRARTPGGPPTWKILDFGVSKLAGTAGTLTRGHVVGTPGYLAPEQATGGDVDHRTDLFALAVVAYRALTGRPAFTGADLPRVLHDVVYRMPDQPSSVAPLAPDVDLVLAIGLAKRGPDRFDGGAELADALAAAARSELDDALRARARDLLAAHPWGAVVDRKRSRRQRTTGGGTRRARTTARSTRRARGGSADADRE